MVDFLQAFWAILGPYWSYLILGMQVFAMMCTLTAMWVACILVAWRTSGVARVFGAFATLLAAAFGVVQLFALWLHVAVLGIVRGEQVGLFVAGVVVFAVATGVVNVTGQLLGGEITKNYGYKVR